VKNTEAPSNVMLSLYERAQKVLPPVALRWTRLGVDRGSGSYLYTDAGRKMLDFACGVGVCVVGHNHPEVVEAAVAQVRRLIHAGHNVAYYPTYVELAEALVALTGGDTMVFFCNSGAEAVEGSIKLARYVTRRPALLAFKGGFHGRTMGAASLTTSNGSFRKHYEPLMPGIYFAEYPYCYRCPFSQRRGSCKFECLKQFNSIFTHLVNPEDLAAMIIEPVAGEGGYIVPPPEFLAGLHELCSRHGVLLIFDEVQTGFGRTGKLFATEHLGFRPDITACAKGIGGGFPLGAIIADRRIMELWPAGAHGGTFGGNPVACAAALAVLKVLQGGALENAGQMGVRLLEGLVALQRRFPAIGDVRGVGLMVAVELVDAQGAPDGHAAKQVIEACEQSGLLLLSCGPHKQCIRFMAPTTVTAAEIDQALVTFESSLATLPS